MDRASLAPPTIRGLLDIITGRSLKVEEALHLPKNDIGTIVGTRLGVEARYRGYAPKESRNPSASESGEQDRFWSPQAVDAQCRHHDADRDPRMVKSTFGPDGRARGRTGKISRKNNNARRCRLLLIWTHHICNPDQRILLAPHPWIPSALQTDTTLASSLRIRSVLTEPGSIWLVFERSIGAQLDVALSPDRFTMTRTRADTRAARG